MASEARSVAVEQSELPAPMNEDPPFRWRPVETDFCLVPQGTWGRGESYIRRLVHLARAHGAVNNAFRVASSLFSFFLKDSPVLGASMTKALNRLCNRVACEVLVRRPALRRGAVLGTVLGSSTAMTRPVDPPLAVQLPEMRRWGA